MLPILKVQNLISKHAQLEKELSSVEIDKKKFAEKSKEYSDLSEIINAAKEYKRSILHVSTSNLLTEGGKIDSVQILYNEDLENPQDFKLLTTYPMSSSGEFFEVTSSLSDGLSPVSHIQKISTPRNPPLKKFKSRWKIITGKTARNRKPSISGW